MRTAHLERLHGAPSPVVAKQTSPLLPKSGHKVMEEDNANVVGTTPPSSNSDTTGQQPTRKEKRKAVVQQRLARQLDRLTAIHARQKLQDEQAAKQQPSSSSAGTEGEGAEADGEASPNAAAQHDPTPAARHDPKFAHGTFWRDRKEKKKRTLFIGNLPAAYPKDAVRDTLEAVVAAAAEHSNTAVDGDREGIQGPDHRT